MAATARSTEVAALVTQILTEAGFEPYDDRSEYPRGQFTVTLGVGVGVAWRDATGEQRQTMLDRMHSVLSLEFAGIVRRDDHLYVPEA